MDSKSVELSVTDRASLVGQMTVISYLKAQVAKLEQEVIVAIIMGYGVDVRKGWTLDLENGVLRDDTPTEQPPSDGQ